MVSKRFYIICPLLDHFCYSTVAKPTDSTLFLLTNILLIILPTASPNTQAHTTLFLHNTLHPHLLLLLFPL